jgi:hypothetical protein
MSNTAPIACQGWKEVYPAAPTEVGMHSNLREVALYRELPAPAGSTIMDRLF